MNNNPSHQAATIMIVDDELFYREVLRDMLSQAGFTIVAEAADGAEAVAKYRTCHPAITIMDVFMPNMNGIEATKAIMAADSNARVLVSTTMGFDDEIQAVMKAGARGEISKPFLADEILAVIQKVLTE